jgi:hypothetical protein
MNPAYDFTGQRAPQGCELGHGLATARGSAGHVDHGGYVASKHAVGLTRVAGAESAPHEVWVNARCPRPNPYGHDRVHHHRRTVHRHRPSLGTCHCCAAQTTLCCSSAWIGTWTGATGHPVSRLV